MLRYSGSGKYWKSHLKLHGNQIETLWYCLFYDKKECEKFALSFSTQQNIVESKKWANLVPENGLYGGSKKGHGKGKPSEKKGKPSPRKGIKLGPLPEEQKQNISKSLRKMFNEGTIVIWNKGKSSARKGIKDSAMSERNKGNTYAFAQRGISQRKTTCPHCDKEGSISNMKRWHFDNCKTNKQVTIIFPDGSVEIK